MLCSILYVMKYTYQTRSKFRDNKAMEISQFIQSKSIKQIISTIQSDSLPEVILVTAGFH